MIQKLKMTLLSMSSLIMFAAPLAAPAAVSALTQTDINQSLCSGTEVDLSGKANCDQTVNENSFNDKLARVINIISAIVGVVAVIMIIFGGFKYITSGGSAEKVKGARDTILYAVVGLIIVALAQVIVHFVINRTAPNA